VTSRAQTEYASSGDLSIAYQVFGDGPVDIVFVPGFMSHVELNWEYVFMSTNLERLGQFARVIVFDKRGSGLSDRSLGAGTLEDAMDDIRAVMDAVEIERAAIVAVSNGGPIATLFAAACPERVSALVLFLSSCPGARPPSPDFQIVLDMVREFWTTGLVLNTIVQHQPDPDEAIAQLARLERYCCTPAVAVELMRRGYEADVTPFLPLIQAPTLVINNRDDPISPLEEATYLAEHVANAKQVVLEGDAHASWRPSYFDEPLRLAEMFLTGEHGSVVTNVERVLSTVLFTDIVQSTDHAVDLGDANWRRVLDRFEATCRDHVSRRQGVFVKNTGDGMLAHFDSPGRAVACAQELADKVGALGLRTRAGVHTGEVERRGDDLSGIAVHIASRVMGTGGPGDVIVSRTVRDLTIGGAFDFVDFGEHTLKGVPGTWPLFVAE